MTEVNKKLPSIAVSVLLLAFLLFIEGICFCQFICSQSNKCIQLQDNSVMAVNDHEEHSHHHPTQCVANKLKAVSFSKLSKLIKITPIQADNQLNLPDKHFFFLKLSSHHERVLPPVKLLILIQTFRC